MKTARLIPLYKFSEPLSLSKDFQSTEFNCHHCEGGWTPIDPLLVGWLQALRNIVQKPVKINSGYRCDEYQERLRENGLETASGRSTHQDGMAADIAVEGYTGEELEKIARRVGFTSVGVAPGWIHVDTRESERRWTYKA